MNNMNLKKYDSEIWDCIEKEKNRQEEHIELIASENYASLCVMEAQGSQLTNKYAEGYPEKRYYGGCVYVDQIEKIAIHRAKLLFHADYVNVQPHSGSQANFAVYHALLQPGDLILGMKLSHGGHLTHGSSVNFSGKIYQSISYGVNETGQIDYNELESLAILHRPKIIIGGFSAYSGLCDWKKMRKIADMINAYFIVDMSHIAGLISSNLYPNPLDFAHVVTSTTHKTLAGPRGGLILAKGNDIELYKKIDSSVFPGIQGGPLMHIIAAKAVAFKEAMDVSFIKYQMQTLKNAQAMVKIFINCGYKVLGNNTYNHLFLIDLTNKKITGKEADIALSLANITINKNSIPNDLKNPFITSGIRIGTPAVTRRGFKEKHVETLAYWIVSILNDITNYNNILKIKEHVINLCLKYPVYNK